MHSGWSLRTRAALVFSTSCIRPWRNVVLFLAYLFVHPWCFAFGKTSTTAQCPICSCCLLPSNVEIVLQASQFVMSSHTGMYKGKWTRFGVHTSRFEWTISTHPVWAKSVCLSRSERRVWSAVILQRLLCYFDRWANHWLSWSSGTGRFSQAINFVAPVRDCWLTTIMVWKWQPFFSLLSGIPLAGAWRPPKVVCNGECLSSQDCHILLGCDLRGFLCHWLSKIP